MWESESVQISARDRDCFEPTVIRLFWYMNTLTLWCLGQQKDKYKDKDKDKYRIRTSHPSFVRHFDNSSTAGCIREVHQNKDESEVYQNKDILAFYWKFIHTFKASLNVQPPKPNDLSGELLFRGKPVPTSYY